MKRISHAELSRFLTAGARYVLAGVFAVSATGKILSPSQFKSFVAAVAEQPLLSPTTWLYGIAGAELLVSILLVIPSTRMSGGVAAFTLILAFSSLLIYGSFVAQGVPCGCFGSAFLDSSLSTSIARNLILLLLSAMVFFCEEEPVKQQ